MAQATLDLASLLASSRYSLSDFTPSEQACISRKIEILLGEGKPKDQAVAIAISVCAPEKSRGASASLSSEKQFGGAYDADQNADGTWNIRDVPIMGVIPKGAKRNEEPIDGAWMKRAIARAQSRESEGYLPPLHIKHHGFGVETKRAGFFRLTRIGLVPYEGKQLPALFADLIRIPQDVFETIERSEVPYRSVEIHDWNVTEVDSLALLEDEVPFFRLELLTVGRKIAASADRAEAHYFAKAPLAPVAVLVSDRGGAALFRMEDSDMVERRLIDPLGGKLSAEAKLEDEEKKDEAKLESPPEEKKPEWAMKLEEKVDSLASGLAKLLGEDEEENESMQDDEEKKEEEDSAPVDFSAKEVARLEGRVSGLEAKLSARDRKDEIDGKVDGIVAALVADGYNVDSKTKEKISRFASKGDDLVDDFVEQFKLSASKEPPTTLEGLEMKTLSGKEPEEVLRFSSNPDDLAVALQAWTEFEELKSRGLMGEIPLSTHVQLSVDRARAIAAVSKN